MFGTVDLAKPHTLIRVKYPVELFTVRRAVLTPGNYAIQGDIRGRFRNTAERRKIVAGLFSLEYVEPMNALNTPEPLPPAEPPVNHPDAEIDEPVVASPALVVEPVAPPVAVEAIVETTVIAAAEAIVAETAVIDAPAIEAVSVRADTAAEPVRRKRTRIVDAAAPSEPPAEPVGETPVL